MSIVETPDIYGFTIFCDDIREEVNSRKSFMGVILSPMAVHATFPAGIKLSLSVHFHELLSLALQRDWEVPLVVYGPGQTMENPPVRTMIPPIPEESRETIKGNPTYGSEERFYTVGNIVFGFSPFVISEPGFIRVRALYKDDVIKLGSLRVDQGPIPED